MFERLFHWWSQFSFAEPLIPVCEQGMATGGRGSNLPKHCLCEKAHYFCPKAVVISSNRRCPDLLDQQAHLGLLWRWFATVSIPAWSPVYCGTFSYSWSVIFSDQNRTCDFMRSDGLYNWRFSFSEAFRMFFLTYFQFF